MSTITYPHIEIGPNGKAYIDGTGFKVHLLVEEYLSGNTDAIELQRRHPQLSLGQVHGALTYYHDHKPEFDLELVELESAGQSIQRGDAISTPITTLMSSLGEPELTVKRAIPITIQADGDEFIATYFDCNLSAGGETVEEAYQNLQAYIADVFRLHENSDEPLGTAVQKQRQVLFESICRTSQKNSPEA